MGKVFIGALIAVNLGLVGLLFFRDRSVSPIHAEGTNAAPATAAAPAAAPVTAAAVPPATSHVPAQATTEAPVTTAPAPASAPVAVVQPPEPVEQPVERPAARQAQRTRETREARPTEKPRKRETTRETARETERYPREEEAVAAYKVPGGNGEPEPWRKIEEERHQARIEPKAVPALPETVTLAAGTNLPVKLDVALHSRQVKNGDSFDASLAKDLVVDGRTLARAGAEVTGRVREIVEAGKTSGSESMKLTLTALKIGGKTYRIETSAAAFQAEKEGNKDAAIIGGAAAAGALIGAIAGGGKGAAIGAVTGAAAGTGVVITTRGKPIVLASGTQLDFTLESAIKVSLPPSARPDASEPETDPEKDEGVAHRR